MVTVLDRIRSPVRISRLQDELTEYIHHDLSVVKYSPNRIPLVEFLFKNGAINSVFLLLRCWGMGETANNVTFSGIETNGVKINSLLTKVIKAQLLQLKLIHFAMLGIRQHHAVLCGTRQPSLVCPNFAMSVSTIYPSKGTQQNKNNSNINKTRPNGLQTYVTGHVWL